MVMLPEEGEMPKDTKYLLPSEAGALLGFKKNGQPFFLIAGGAPEDDDQGDDGNSDDETDSGDDVTDDSTDDADDVTDDGGQDDKKDGSQGKKPTTKPSTRPAPAKADGDDPAAGLKKALTAERARARNLEREFKELQKKHATAEERQLLEAKEQASAEAEERVKGPLIKALAASELRVAGVQTGTAKLVGLLDLSKVELGDDGELVGLEEQIEELKDEFPNLFAASTGNGVKAPNANGGSGSKSGRTKDRSGEDPRPKGFAQLLADQVTGAAPLGQGMAGR